MPVITDVPTREGLDGAGQLLLLRSYLRDPLGEGYPDDLLIPLLVSNARVKVWAMLKGYPYTAVPWSYSLTGELSHVNRIRMLTGDTSEANLATTDYEILKVLKKYPLRYAVVLLKARNSVEKTKPVDPNNPITIMRQSLDGQGVLPSESVHTDGAISVLLLTSGLNPFELSLDIMEANIRGTVSQRSSTTSASSGFASLDGVSFSKEGQADQLTALQRGEDLRSLVDQLMASVYYIDTTYNVSVGGVDLVGIDLGDWYEL